MDEVDDEEIPDDHGVFSLKYGRKKVNEEPAEQVKRSVGTKPPKKKKK